MKMRLSILAWSILVIFTISSARAAFWAIADFSACPRQYVSNTSGKDGPFATREAALARIAQVQRESPLACAKYSVLDDGAGASSGTATPSQPTGGGFNSQPSSAGQLGEALGKGLFSQPASGGTGGTDSSQQQIAAQQLNKMGLWYLRNHDYKNARIEFEKARRINPGDPAIEANLKRTYNQPDNSQVGNGAGSQLPPVTDNSSYSSAAGVTPSADTSAGGQRADQTVGIKGLPGIYLNDTTGNGSDKGYGIKGLPGIYVNGPGDGSGLKQPSTPSGTDTEPQVTQTTAAPADEPVKGLPPAPQPTADASGKPKIDLGNADKPDFDGNNGGNRPISGSGGSSPTGPSSHDGGVPNQAAAEPSGGTTTPTQSGGQQAVQLGVSPDKAGLTPIAGEAAAGSGNNTSAGNQLVSAAAAGQNSGGNFDSGGKYAGSLPTSVGGTGNGGVSGNPSSRQSGQTITNGNNLGQGLKNDDNSETNSPCLKLAQLQNQFQYLMQDIEVNRQVIKNFGFDKTVEQIEYFGTLEERQVEEAKEEFNSMLLDAVLSSTTDEAGKIGSLDSETIDVLNRLADAQGSPELGEFVDKADQVNKALKLLKKTKSVYKIANAAKKGEILKSVIKLGGLICSAPWWLTMLAEADRWAVYEAYQAGNAVYMVQQLTKANEGDLILLKSRSEKLRDEVNLLTSIKKKIAILSSECDSSKLSRKPE